MPADCKVPQGRVCPLFQFFHTKTQKITKNARILLYLCVHKFFHEQKKTHFFTKKIWGQIAIRMLWTRIVTSDFRVEKKREKTCKKHVPGIWMGPKNASKIIIFSSKMSITFSMQTLYFSPLSICKWSKKHVQKSFIFSFQIHVFFPLQNHRFLSSRCIDGLQKLNKSCKNKNHHCW